MSQLSYFHLGHLTIKDSEPHITAIYTLLEVCTLIRHTWVYWHNALLNAYPKWKYHHNAIRCCEYHKATFSCASFYFCQSESLILSGHTCTLQCTKHWHVLKLLLTIHCSKYRSHSTETNHRCNQNRASLRYNHVHVDKNTHTYTPM